MPPVSQFAENAPHLPIWFLVPGTLLTFALVLWGARRLDTGIGRFLLIAAWLRIVFDAWAFLTLASYGGVKPIQLLSLGTIAVGVFVLDWRWWFNKVALIFGALAAAQIIAGVVNGDPLGGVDPALRYLYLVIFMLATLEASWREGLEKVATWLLTAFAPIFLFQLASIALGVGKVNERDFSEVYIGGFGHESLFSILLIAFLITVRFATRVPVGWRVILTLITAAALLSANYRTAILAAAPILAWQLGELAIGSIQARYRNVALVLIGIVGFGAVSGAVLAGGERYNDVWAIARDPGNLITRPDEFSRDERRAGSGRRYLWSSYYYGWSDAPVRQKTLGHGADAWQEPFKFNAQNSLLAMMYEAGAVGGLILVLIWAVAFGYAVAARSFYLVIAHVGFILLNMSTTPFDMVDGLLLTGLLYAYTLVTYFAVRRRRSEGASRTWRPATAQLARET